MECRAAKFLRASLYALLDKFGYEYFGRPCLSPPFPQSHFKVSHEMLNASDQLATYSFHGANFGLFAVLTFLAFSVETRVLVVLRLTSFIYFHKVVSESFADNAQQSSRFPVRVPTKRCSPGQGQHRPTRHS